MLPDEQEGLRLFRAVWDPGGNRKVDPAGWFHHPVPMIVSTPGYSGAESREPFSGKIYSVNVEGPNEHQDCICTSLQRNCVCTVSVPEGHPTEQHAGDSLSQS
ncbi:hypothetical protein DPMN_156801 [Dreissena polymorpha]|uniref:Uncharacterized protein n=1 Tax=Dreissena polymorpha TaxID=45954 RepID=A0A9D4FRV4_DREPO|nr:hypothetical protein DPMN_156801 [Dreissena polymorpha]